MSGKLFSLGLKSIRYEWIAMTLTSAALAAVLGPLLLLYGFKFGIIQALLAELDANPSTRQIVIQGEHNPLDADQIDAMRKVPGIAFLEPTSRTLAARAFLQKSGDGAGLSVQIEPTGAGDPILPRTVAPRANDTVLSFAAAADLGLSAGDEVRLSKQRSGDKGEETFAIRLRVLHVAARGAVTGKTAYILPAMVEALEQFADGYAVPDQGLAGRNPEERTQRYANVRLYAQTLEDVKLVAGALSGMGYQVTSRADEVEQVATLNRNLAAVFAMIAVVGAVGYTVSLAASLATMITQKRRLLSLLRLMGATRMSLLFFPLAQALAIASVGYGFASVLFFAVSEVANRRFAGALPNGGAICELTPAHFAMAAGATAAVAFVVVLIVGRAIARIAPAQVLHES